MQELQFRNMIYKDLLYSDTIVAPATLPGTGAVSIIRISGKDTFIILDKIIKFKKGKAIDFKGYTLHFGTVYNNDDLPLDDVLVSIFKKPHSYTGEDSAEISCHASSYITSEIIRLVCEAGARIAMHGEFTQKAYMNGKLDLAQAESVADIIASQNAASHRLAFNQLRGGFSKELMEMRAELLNMLSLMELELDFSEEDVEFADRSKLKELLKKISTHINDLVKSFHLGNAIRTGIPVAIVGAANSGKSTLLNALIGEDRAIVSDIPGTTRDTVEENFIIEGVNFRLIDTAGIRETTEIIEKIGIEKSLEKLSKADIVIGVIDGSLNEKDVLEQANYILSKCSSQEQKIILVLNKKDIFDKDDNENKNVSTLNNIVSLINTKLVTNRTKIIKLSAAKNFGIDELKNTLFNMQSEMTTGSDTTLVTNVRHYRALKDAYESLLKVKNGLDTSLPTDLISADLHEAVNALSSITGMDITTDEVLGNIFKNFCIGK